MEIKTIKKALMQGGIQLSKPAIIRMEKRGYTKADLISGIMQGELTETQVYQGRLSFVIEGMDTDNWPIVIVVGFGQQPRTFVVITAIPPTAEKFKRVI